MKPRILVLGNENYINAIEYCGGEAIYSYSPSDSLDFDGLLLCGGNDIHPSYYGQEINGAVNFDISRDECEMALLKSFLDTGKPILGICRGLQLLNVALGGTLIQDLPCANLHRSHNGNDSVHTVTAQGVLEKLYGKNPCVNSSHHQAIDTLGSGLVASAWCDRVIEAIEHVEKPYFAVQFHPERMKRADTVDGIKIFEYFIELCKNKSV